MQRYKHSSSELVLNVITGEGQPFVRTFEREANALKFIDDHIRERPGRTLEMYHLYEARELLLCEKFKEIEIAIGR